VVTAVPLRTLVGSVVEIPGARRWWIEPINRGFELHGEVGSGHDVAGTRETRLAAGAGLFALHLAVAALDVRPVTTLLPRAGRRGLLALLREGAVRPPTPAERTLYATLRRGVPRALKSVSSPWPLLRRAADAEGAWLHSTTESAGQAALRELLVGHVEMPADGHLLLIGSPHDLPVCQLRAGRAIQRVLLTAAVIGHTAAVLAGPSRLNTSRRVLRAAGLGTGVVPQALLSIAPHG
jgi:hypothetical protein